MPNAFDLVERLTAETLAREELPWLLSDFSYQFGWRPSDVGETRTASDFANAHLIVEHGLDNTAVLTFLPRTKPASYLQTDEWRQLLGISYNNLVDWHILVDADSVRYVFNRAQPTTETLNLRIGPRDYSALTPERFEQAIGQAPNPNILALDDALIETISRWKRVLASALGDLASNRHFSALFNAILLVRAVEDIRSRDDTRILPDLATSTTAGVPEIVQRCISDLTQRSLPEGLWRTEDLQVFDRLDRQDLRALFEEFYCHRGVPYRYDFAVISKHALSRVYEKYVSVLRYPASAQLSFLPAVPDEQLDKASGAVYTPHFIAKFFARFIQEHLPPAGFKKAKVADLACGSGIFLRTVMEAQLQTPPQIRDPSVLPEALASLLGVDIDENACAASKLSLAVLYLAASGEFPVHLPIEHAEAIDYFESHPQLQDSLDAFVVNPPFIRIEALPSAMRTRIAEFLVGISAGRLDAYLPFLVIGVRALKPGAFGLFVLPESFLTSDNAKGLRRWLREHTWIRCLADLSAVRVFDRPSSYVILLVVEKKAGDESSPPPATVIRCQNYPGHALQDYLDGKRLQTHHYSIYDVTQDHFDKASWFPSTRADAALEILLTPLPKLSDLAETRQGVITGADSVYILPVTDVPEGEDQIYRPYMPDKLMTHYWPRRETGLRIFYPFDDDRKLTEAELRERFPETWRRLTAHRQTLERRSAVQRGDIDWWELAWPRSPSLVLRPKIMGPTIILLPRFCFDAQGSWVVGRTFYIRPKSDSSDEDLLKYLLAVLNSSTTAWYLKRNARTFRGGYNKIEVKTLRQLPIPDPAKVSLETLNQILASIDELRAELTPDASRAIRANLDRLVSGLYGLTFEQSEALVR